MLLLVLLRAGAGDHTPLYLDIGMSGHFKGFGGCEGSRGLPRRHDSFFIPQTTISAVLTTDNYSEYFLVKGARRKKMSEIPNDATTSRNLIMLVVGLLITTVAVAAIAAMVAY